MKSFAKTETQLMLADMACRLLGDENEFEVRRHRLAGKTADRLALWPVLAAQGVLGTAFTEEAGGFGGSMRDLAVLMEVIGQHLVVEPVLASAVCGRILQAAGETDELASIIAGERIFALAYSEGFDPFAVPATTARRAGEDFCLNGQKIAVRHGDIADRLIVTARLDGAASCFLVAANAPGLRRDIFRLIDAASAATLRFADTPAKFLGGKEVLDDALLWSLIGLCAEANGIFEALNEATFAYLDTRKQFGVTLASFQALKHRAADMLAGAEEARALTGRAIAAVDENGASRFALASGVKALVDEIGRKIGHEAVQMHGGMGVSDELNISHYMRRLAAIRAELGSADLHRGRFAILSDRASHAA